MKAAGGALPVPLPPRRIRVIALHVGQPGAAAAVRALRILLGRLQGLHARSIALATAGDGHVPRCAKSRLRSTLARASAVVTPKRRSPSARRGASERSAAGARAVDARTVHRGRAGIAVGLSVAAADRVVILGAGRGSRQAHRSGARSPAHLAGHVGAVLRVRTCASELAAALDGATAAVRALVARHADQGAHAVTHAASARYEVDSSRHAHSGSLTQRECGVDGHPRGDSTRIAVFAAQSRCRIFGVDDHGRARAGCRYGRGTLGRRARPVGAGELTIVGARARVAAVARRRSRLAGAHRGRARPGSIAARARVAAVAREGSLPFERTLLTGSGTRRPRASPRAAPASVRSEQRGSDDGSESGHEGMSDHGAPRLSRHRIVVEGGALPVEWPRRGTRGALSGLTSRPHSVERGACRRRAAGTSSNPGNVSCELSQWRYVGSRESRRATAARAPRRRAAWRRLRTSKSGSRPR